MNLWCGYMYNPFLHLHIAAHTFPKLSHEQITEHLQQFSLFPSLWNLFSPLNDDLPAVSNSWISPVFSSCHSLVDIVSPCESVSVAQKYGPGYIYHSRNYHFEYFCRCLCAYLWTRFFKNWCHNPTRCRRDSLQVSSSHENQVQRWLQFDPWVMIILRMHSVIPVQDGQQSAT